MKTAFVILHYNAIEETHKCIRYIKENIDTQDYKILVVDNASPNHSGKILQEQYTGDEKVRIILNKRNLGFAKGNNVGFLLAKKEYCPDYIVMMNNDVFLLEKKLSQKLEQEYTESGFYVAGPMVLTGDGRCDVNPDAAVIRTVADIDRFIQQYQKMYRRYKYHYADLYNRLGRIYAAVFGKNRPKKKKDYLHRQEDVKLHGCCLFFSKDYIAEYDGLDESTFLYWEEEFLYKHMKDDHKKTVYMSDIIVYHQEDAATDSVIEKQREKQMFVYKNYIRSLEALKTLYKK